MSALPSLRYRLYLTKSTNTLYTTLKNMYYLQNLFGLKNLEGIFRIMVTKILCVSFIISLSVGHTHAMEDETSRRYETEPLLPTTVTERTTEATQEDANSKAFRLQVEELALKFDNFDSFSKDEQKNLLAAVESCCSTMSCSAAGMHPRITISKETEQKVTDMMKIYAQHRPARCVVN